MQKKSEEAAAEFREALRLNPAHRWRVTIWAWRSPIRIQPQAIANWQTASDPATAHSNLAAVWIEKGNYAEARKELVIALGYNRTHPAALRNMELVSRLDGQAGDRFRRQAAETPLGSLEVGLQAAVRRAAGIESAAKPLPITGEQQ